jgi:hypothetical protein
LASLSTVAPLPPPTFLPHLAAIRSGAFDRDRHTRMLLCNLGQQALYLSLADAAPLFAMNRDLGQASGLWHLLQLRVDVP